MEANEHIQKIFDERKDFIIIATTGKNMSKVTDVCKLLVGNQLPDHATQPSDTKEFEDSEIREFKVVYRYLHHNWRPFIEINVTSVILSYLLETDIDQMYQKEIGPDNQKLYDLLEQSFSNKNVMEKGIRERVININKSLKFKEDTEEDYKTEILNKCDEIIDEIYNSQDKITYLHNLIKETDYRDKTAELQIKYFCIYFGVLPEMNAYLEDILRESGTYTQIFQDYGNNIRAYGRALYSDDCTIRAENIFSIPERIKYCFKLLRRYENNMKQIMQNDTSYKVLENNPSNNGESKKETKVYVVINNLKNIFEAYYFRCRYSSFYLVSIACDEKMRQENFNNNTTYLLTELKENLSYGKKVFRRVDQYITENRLVGENEFDKSRKYNDAKS